MSTKHAVLDDTAVANGADFRVRYGEESVRPNTSTLSAAAVNGTAACAVDADNSDQSNKSASFDPIVPQCQCRCARLVGVGMHCGWDVLESVVEKPMWDGGAQREDNHLPAKADREKDQPWSPTGGRAEPRTIPRPATTRKPYPSHADQ
jgi:hypothetical protein